MVAVSKEQVSASAQLVPAAPVVLTAQTAVWLRIYDQAGERLFEKEMAKGESYTVPPQANNPMILTGRPNALAVTVGGKPVAPLGPPERTIVDVPVSAAALLARAVAAPAPQPVSPPTAAALPPVSAPSPAAAQAVPSAESDTTTASPTPPAD